MPGRGTAAADRQMSTVSDGDNLDERIRQISLSCSRHKDRLAMLHCTTCDLPVCCACSMTTTHCDHDRQDIDDFVEDQRQQLRDQIRHVESYQRQVDDQISRTRRDSDKLIENTGEAETEIRKHHENILRRLEADFQTVLQGLHSARETEAKRLHMRISDLEMSKLELEGLHGRLEEVVSRGTDADVIRERLAQKWKPSSPGSDTSYSCATISFSKNSLLSQLRSNVIGKVTSSRPAADNDNRGYTTQPDKRKGKPVVPTCSTAVGDRRQSWRCSKCTYMNSEKDFFCTQCNSRQWSDNGAVDSSVPVKPSSSNPSTANRVIGLVGRLQIPLPRISTKSHSSGEQWTPEDCRMPKWQCIRCTAENYAWSTKCETCHSAH